MSAYDASGQNETEIYAYSFSQSERIRNIMAHKDEKLLEEEASEHLKNGRSQSSICTLRQNMAALSWVLISNFAMPKLHMDGSSEGE